VVGFRSNGVPAGGGPRSLAVVGAKGGVGRSVLALNLAVTLGHQQRVLLLDADFPGGDLATLAGVDAPASILEPTPSRAIPVTETVDLAQLGDMSTNPGGTSSLENDLAWEGSYDWIIADTGTGIDRSSLSAALAADHVLLLTAPELPAVADGYATLKAVHQSRPDLLVACVVNMVDSQREAESIFVGLNEMANVFLGAQIDNLGYIPFNRAVRTAAKSQTPFVLSFPSSTAAMAVADIATQLSERSTPPRLSNEGSFLEVFLRTFGEFPPLNRHQPLQEVWATP
jgi:flagellar biosynthesis protein FlhG